MLICDSQNRRYELLVVSAILLYSSVLAYSTEDLCNFDIICKRMGHKMSKKETAVQLCVIIAIVVYLISAYPVFSPVPEITTTASVWLLSFFVGVAPAHQGNIMFISLNDQTRLVNISAECSGIAIIAIFVLVIFITPGIKLQHRFLSFIFLPVLWGANVIRIVSGIMLGTLTNVDMLLIFHSSIGQVIVFTAMIMSYIIFLKMFGYFKVNTIKFRSSID